jgi:hypothetical protein
MVKSSAQLCGTTVRWAVEAMRRRDGREFLRELARILRKNSVDRRASLFGDAGDNCNAGALISVADLKVRAEVSLP